MMSGLTFRHLQSRLELLIRRRGVLIVLFLILVSLMLYLTMQLFTPITDIDVTFVDHQILTKTHLAAKDTATEKPMSHEDHDAIKKVRVAPADPRTPTKELIAVLQERLDTYDPKTEVAFAIPVGGKTQRAVQLGEILNTLIKGGAPPQNIFVMEDVEGRPNRLNDPKIGAMASKHGVRVISSHVSREDMPETHLNFGIHLARHYKFMLDFLLVSPLETNAQGQDREFKRNPEGTPYQFAVFIEDDLVLSADFTKYFYSMSRVMSVDSSLYCVSAHQDNAFFGTSYEPEPGTVTALDKYGFDFRRGNHFMAPGWMTSRRIYTEVVRPKFLDGQGQYAFKDQLHLRNGHWDRFFDSLIGDKDCIFPEIPRISHQGADGFTVDQRGQMELYSNLRLSTLPVDVDYGDLHRLTKSGYIETQIEFVEQAIRLTSLEESRLYRHQKLVYVVAAKDDKDELWNAVLNGFFGLIGIGGYGGYEGYVKVRGIFNGAVYVRWITNLIMLVGAYSPYLAAVEKLQPRLNFEMTNGGCFHDKGGKDSRDLSLYVPYYKPALLSPRSCLSSCIHLGYKYGGLQAGMECWCGQTYGRYGQVTSGSSCDQTCGTNFHTGIRNDPVTCGGDWKNSIYWHGTDEKAHVAAIAQPDDVIFIQGGRGESCTEACASASTPLRKVQCAESYFPLIHRHCSILQSLIGCTTCQEDEDMTRGVYSPGGFPHGACTLSKGRYIRCSAKPNDDQYRRACVCQIKGGITKA